MKRSSLRVPLLASLSCLVLAHPAPIAPQVLSDLEQRIARYVEEHHENAIALLERVVNINSGTLNVQGVREVGAVFREELDALGFETEWIDLPPSANRAGHLFARRTGTRGKKILMIGHLDTVFEESSPFQTFRREGSTATGPGTADMKGGDVVMLLALQALASVDALEGTSITVAITGDEESPGDPLSVARRDLIEAGKAADVALGFEGGVKDGDAEYATVARRGSTGWTLEVEGRQGHSSRIFSDELGAGAIFEASRILYAFYEELRGEELLTFNAGTIVGGTEVTFDPEDASGTVFGKTNVVPKRVIVRGGIRTITLEQLERTREEMRKIVDQSLPGTSARITFRDGYPPMAPTEGNLAYLETYTQVSQDLGYGPLLALDPGRRGAADISFVAPHVDGLSGMGTYGSGAHSPEEAVDLDSLVVAAQRAAILIYRLTQE